MSREGFEALADATLLLTLLAAATMSLASIDDSRASDPRETGLPIAEQLRLALFRTTADGLGYSVDGDEVRLPDGSTIELFLRLEVKLAPALPDANWSASNDHVGAILAHLRPPGWEAVVLAASDGISFAIPADLDVPETHFASVWTYPSLDGSSGSTRLRVEVWLSPPR